jgi:general secretion pathway protein B
MSYILDALKKAEQERGNAPLQSVAVGRVDRPFYRNRWRPVVLTSTVCIVGILCFFWLYKGTSKDIIDVSKHPETRTDPTHPIDPSSNFPKSGQSAAGANPVSSITPVKPPERIPARAIVGGHQLTAPKTTPTVPKPNEPAPSISPNGNQTFAQTQQAAEPEKSDPDPTSLREATTKMKVTMLMYSDNPSERIVFINSHKYKEGDYVESRYRLEKIALDGVELSFKGERIFVRP